MKDGIDTGQRAAHCLRRTDVSDKQLDAAFEITRWFTFWAVDLRIEIIKRPHSITASEKCGSTMRGDETSSSGN
jgi:hypothetical protein